MLDSHRQDGLHRVLGTVREAQVTGSEGTALIQFSARPEVEPIWQDVVAGILRHVSVGYTVQQWAETNDATGSRTRTAVAWTPFEISLVPTPADPGATVRTMEQGMINLMTPSEPEAAVQTRAQVNAEIRGIARVAGLGQEFVDTLIDRQASADDARRSAFEELAKRSSQPLHTAHTIIEVGPSHDDPVTRAGWMGEALYSRIQPAHTLSEPARRYAYATPAEMARELLNLRGLPTTGFAPAALITRALHSTSDFSLIVGDTIGRTLRAAYQAAPTGIRRLGRQTTARDFRTVNKIMLGEAPTLERLNETGEIKAGTLAEAKESYKVDTFARKIGISRQVLVNDDLGAFADLSRRMGQAAAETEAGVLVALLEANTGNGPKMTDGKVLFHSDHANKAGAGGAIADTTLSAARLALRSQTGLSGQRISATPKYLLVPAALETTAEKWLATIAAAKAADVNPFAGSLALVVEPRLTSTTRWYVSADPSEIDGLEYAYLAGGQGPQVESKSGWDVDGVEIRVILDFGAGFIDWRGWYANGGA
ncbi:MAG: prohead protease/major capsid protein fusion protein [Rhodospirillaceae bacterium]